MSDSGSEPISIPTGRTLEYDSDNEETEERGDADSESGNKYEAVTINEKGVTNEGKGENNEDLLQKKVAINENDYTSKVKDASDEKSVPHLELNESEETNIDKSERHDKQTLDSPKQDGVENATVVRRREPTHRKLASIRGRPDSGRRHTIASNRHKQDHRVPLDIKRQSLDSSQINKTEPKTDRQTKLPSIGSNLVNIIRFARQSVINGIGFNRPPEAEERKNKAEVDRLWKIKTNLLKKENFGKDSILSLKGLIIDTLELLGKVRARVRDKEVYSDADVEYHSREVNTLQLLFHGILEIWLKMKDKVKESDKTNYKNVILPETMELATDLTSLLGEVMALFLQRFNLNIIPMLRPVHGLHYGLAVHCRFNCLEKDTIYRDGASNVYSGFISAIMSFLRGTKVLLKRLKFEDEVGTERRRLVQSTICKFIKDIQSVLVHGLHAISLEEYRRLLHRLGSLCSDAFFTIGKTSGITGSLDMGEGVTALQPLKLLGNISHCDVVRCLVEDRPEVINGLKLQEGQHFVSDIYQITGAPFCTSEKILLRFPSILNAMPPTAIAKVKVKYGTKWSDINAEIKNNHIEFESKMISAFIAVAGYRGVHREVTTDGYNFVSDDDTRVRISIPKNCYSVPCITKFRVIQLNRNRMYGYKDLGKEESNGIVALSDILNVTHDENLQLNKPMLVHLPILHDDNDGGNDLVVFERSLDGKVHIWYVNDIVKCERDGNCYTFSVSNLNNSIALGKIKRKMLKKNKNKLIEEFNLYCGLEHLCNIVVYMDKNLLTVGVVKLWIEIVDKRFSSRVHRRRANQGMFEVPGSRSPDLRLKELDLIRIELDGSIQKIREIPSEHYSIVFLSTARDNYRSFHVEERRDPRGRHVGILNFLIDTQGENLFLHSATIDVNRYITTLCRVPSSKSDARPHTFGRMTFSRQSRSSRSSGRSVKSTFSYKSMFVDETPVLSHQSLLVLAGAMSVETAQMLGVELGLTQEDMLNIKTINQPTVLTVFEILWLWRGKQVTSTMGDELIDGLKRIESNHLASVVAKAQRERRHITRPDLK